MIQFSNLAYGSNSSAPVTQAPTLVSLQQQLLDQQNLLQQKIQEAQIITEAG